LIREITLQVPLDEALGKVIFEAIPFTVGVALANQVLADSPDDNSFRQSSNNSSSEAQLNATLSDIGATLLGALLVAFSIAPTDEVDMVAIAVSQPRMLAILAASLLISYGIVFEADFAKQTKRMQQKGIFQRPLSETIVSYLLSLVAALLMLLFFQKLSWSDPWTMWLSYTLVLGLPATIGGAAGRLAV
jgi:putative integral membrane protein (TIGR02587 family)